MPRKLVIPAFALEAEEARWLDSHKKIIEREIERRIRQSDTLTLRQAMERARHKAPLKPVTIRMQAEVMAAARSLAATKGMAYQTYIKLLLREALQREVKKMSRAAR